MTKLNGRKIACIVLTFCAAIAARAQTFKTLVNFDGRDGDNPDLMSLVQGTDGNLYGMTVGGGNRACSPQNYGCGTIFRITPQGQLTTVYRFCSQPDCTDGTFPSAPLVLASDGSFYGTTNGGGKVPCDSNNYGCGTVFKISRQGILTTLYTFDYFTGSSPNAGLIQAIDGDFYGTTTYGGTGGYGTVFKITAEGTLTTLYNFTSSDAYPYGDLVQGTDGNFYGTTEGFPLSYGTIFKMTAAGKVKTLPLSLTDGTYPFAGLIQALNGNFYGTTYGGGENNSCGGGCGTVFEVSREGSLTVLYSFCAQPGCADGYQLQAPLVQATDGNFYGTTRFGANSNCSGGCGTVFQITPAGVLTTLHSFDGTDGASSLDGMVQATSGIFYGATGLGGDFCTPDYCGGTIYSLDMGLGPFVAFVRRTGKIGQIAEILGQNFTGATGVSFNGISASFNVKSDTYLTATVPSGATTGYVTVTTPTGVLTSNVPFQVIP